MSFLGKTISLQVFNPDLLSPISERADAVVAADIEFDDVEALELPGESVVNVDIDFSASRIAYTIDTTAYTLFASTPSFNGYKFSDEYDNVDPIIGVTILAGASPIDLAPDAVFFSENAVFIDVDGLSFRNGDTIDLEIAFGSPDNSGSVVPIEIEAVARLYAAAFSRAPDDPGLNYWIDQLETGTGLDAIANNFFFSAEFAQLFGAPNTLSDQELVEILYENILSRPGEKAGIDFWVETLAEGYARPNLLIQFATSAENVALTGYVDDMAQNLSGTQWLVT
ncbi:DUF4214 domain-containing protein [Mesorhizobium sp. CAU 1741]|uniref:DUF4214 domain-containing protein n=1 Tax=Mesorhizobium sp. CAU 1741 TaxID=3140366 RepID=UPI00325B7587